MNTKKEIIDLSQKSSQEGLNKMAQICQKLNYIFEKEKTEKKASNKNEKSKSLELKR